MTAKRRLSRLVVAATLVAMFTVSTAEAKTNPQPQCPDRPGRTLAVSEGLRVYQTVVQDKKDPDANTLRVFSCRKLERKAKMLVRNRNNLDGAIDVVEVVIGGGRWVAISYWTATGVSDGHSVQVYDARNGQSVGLLSVEYAAISPDINFGQLQISPSGSVAFTHNGALTTADAAGVRTVVPASGTEVPSTSDIAVAGNHLYWTVPGGMGAGSALMTGHLTGTHEL